MPEEPEEPEVVSSGDGGGGPKGPELPPPSDADDGEEPDVSLALMEPANMPVFRLERMEEADNSATGRFLTDALGYVPDGKITREEALKLVRYYARHKWAEMKPLPETKDVEPEGDETLPAEVKALEAPAKDPEVEAQEAEAGKRAGMERTRSRMRDDITRLRSFVHIQTWRDMCWRSFEDRLKEPEKEDTHFVHPFVMDALFTSGILIAIILLFHFVMAKLPMMSKLI